MMAKRAGRWIAGAINFRRLGHAVRPPLGRDRAPPVPAFRALLLSGDPVRHRAQAQARRGRRAGRAQARPRLHAGHHPFRPLHRRSGAAARRRRLPRCASAPMWKRPARSLRRPPRSARIWPSRNRTERADGVRAGDPLCRPTIRKTSSPRSCAASCRATRSTKTTRCWPSSTSCRARQATRWCCRRRPPATCSTSSPTTSPRSRRLRRRSPRRR